VHDPGEFAEAASVRPYAVTGGRTRGSGALLPIEALATGAQRPVALLSGERGRILDLTMGQFLSIAELSAHLKLPVGVVRVLVADLADDGLLRIEGADHGQHSPAATLSILESVLDGISAL
jgi:Protein of unknown function (DUF742)